jgi:hypothetical protein
MVAGSARWSAALARPGGIASSAEAKARLERCRGYMQENPFVGPHTDVMARTWAPARSR